MITVSVMVGKADAGWIVCGPVPGMSKMILSVPGLALASSKAWRNEPGPELSVLVTTIEAGVALENITAKSERWVTVPQMILVFSSREVVISCHWPDS